MENKFERNYQEEVRSKKAFMEAVEKGDQEAIQKAVEAQNLLRTALKNEGEIFTEIYLEYKRARDNGNEELNFRHNVKKTGEYLECLKKNGIERFTFSEDYGGDLSGAWKWQEAGCRVIGLTKIQGEKVPFSEEHEKIAALIFTIE